MEDLRSKSCNANKMQKDPTYNTHQSSHKFQDFRCQSASYASSSQTQMEFINSPNAVEVKKVSSRSISRIWSLNLNDPELQRKKRIASYRALTVEGKAKRSIKKSIRWIKIKCSKMVYGFRS